MTTLHLKKVNDNLTTEQGQRHKKFFKNPGIFLLSTTELSRFGLEKLTEINVLSVYEANDRLIAVCDLNSTRVHIPAGKLTPKYYVPSHTSKIEQTQFELLKRQIETLKIELGSSYIPLWTPHGFKDVIDVNLAERIKGVLTKCDFVLKLRNGEEYYISHKGIEHQQFGGVANFYENYIVSDFIQTIKNLGYDGVPRGRPFARWLRLDNKEENDLIHRSVFGIDWNGKYGLNNVHLILHGDVNITRLKTDEALFELTATHKTVNSSLYSIENIGPFFIMAAFRGDRGKHLKKTRIFISGPQHRKPEGLKFI